MTHLSVKQCLAHANQYQKPFLAMHGQIKVSSDTPDANYLTMLADFQIHPDGRMMLSLEKIGFTVAMILIDQENMFIWSSKDNHFWQGTVAEGMNRIFSVKMDMQDFMQLFYVSWNDQNDLHVQESSKWISIKPSNKILHKIKKDTCRLNQSEMQLDFNDQSSATVKTVQYIDLPSKKMIPKKNSVHYGKHQISLSLNQVFEQDFNQKKWEELQNKFLKQLKNQ